MNSKWWPLLGRNTRGVTLYVFLALMVAAKMLAGPREVASRAFPSVAMIVTEDARGQPLAIGSGFFVKKDILASNAHVIENAAAGYIKLIGQNSKSELKGVVAIDTKHDLVLLAVDGAGAPPLQLGDFANVAVGDAIYSVGSPQGLEGTFANGIVSAIRELSGGKVLQLTAPISPGSSGGPILNDSGLVIGVAVAQFKNGQNLNFAIPVTELTSLTSVAGDPRPLTDFSRSTWTGSIFRDLGENSRKGISIGSFIWSGRDLQFVIRNNLRTPVTNIKALMIFYDQDGEPCDFKEVTFPKYVEELTMDTIEVPTLEEMKKGRRISVEKAKPKLRLVGDPVIPPGLAKPDKMTVDPATRLRVTTRAPEVRVLGFDILEGRD